MSVTDTMKSAPLWATLTLALTFVSTVCCFLPDRYRAAVGFLAIFHAAALHTAASGLAAQRRLLELWRSA